MPIVLEFENAICAKCQKEIDLGNYDNQARWVPNEGILCGKCYKEWKEKYREK